MNGLVLVNAKPMRPSRKAISAQYPAMPKWLLLRHTTKPIPVSLAFLMHSSMANVDTTAPRPFCPSTVAVLTVSTTTRGLAWASMRPARSSPQYISARFTPCEGTPRRSAATSTSATSSAFDGEAPHFSIHAAISFSSCERSTKTSLPDFTTSLEGLPFPDAALRCRSRSNRVPKTRPPTRPPAAPRSAWRDMAACMDAD
mmetsp:Transcript_89438/g.251891  ORF Transcript_89438/g.251891 Transcript_89438/m.251891 type:complete len:200 (-) Transcript_89438:69-668(-)